MSEPKSQSNIGDTNLDFESNSNIGQQSINTAGGAVIIDNVNATRDFIGRDKVVNENAQLNLSETITRTRDSLKNNTNINDDDLVLSGTVTNTRNTLRNQTAISAATVVKTILQTHGEYAGRRAEQVNLDERGSGEILPVDSWLQQVRALYDPTLVPKLHGKLVIVGLALLDADLREQLQQNGFLPALIKEIKEKFPDILSEQGRDLYPLLEAESLPPLVIHRDDPLAALDGDQLGRAHFADYLATVIRKASDSQQAYAIHLHAPWGAGKSTVLNFLKLKLNPQAGNAAKPKGWEKRMAWQGRRVLDYLKWNRLLFSRWVKRSLWELWQWRRKQQPQTASNQSAEVSQAASWVVVEFNAWQHQHIRPPWWSLLDRVFRTSRAELNLWYVIQEHWWRISSGRLHYLIAAVLMIWALVFMRPMIREMMQQQANMESSAASSEMALLAAIAKNGDAIIALIVTLWAGFLTASRSLLLNSPNAAQNYVERTADPMQAIARQFDKLMGRLQPKRVAIFIDDLDRCQSAYVVELLEGIQTLFRGSPVVFVVAADQDWLNACFRATYRDIQSQVQEPEKVLGQRFLEKVFQLSTPLPNISESVKAAYWTHLLQFTPQAMQEEYDAAHEKVEAMFANVHSEAQIAEKMKQAENQSPMLEQAMVAKAVQKVTAAVISQEIEHRLLGYHRLVESNPRGMKRLITSYETNRVSTLLARINLDPHQLALWTILMMHWPRLAHYLSKQPELLESMTNHKLADLPDEITTLFKPEDLPAIRRVLKGEIDPKQPSHPLQKETLENCARLYA